MSLTKRAKLLASTMFIGAASLMSAHAAEAQNTQANEPTPVVQNTTETSTWEDIGNFFSDVGDGIASGAEWTYDNALKPAGQGIAAGAEYVYDGAASGVRAASDYVGITTPEEGSENLRANPMRPAEYEAQQAQLAEQRAQEQARINQMRQAYENGTPGMYDNPQIVQPETTFLEDVGTFFSDVGDGIATGAEWTYDNALKPAGQGIADAAVWTYDNALEPAGQGIADAAEWTYDNALKPAGQGIAAGAGFIYDEALVPTGEAISEGAQYAMRGFAPLPTPEDTAYVENLPDFGTFSDDMNINESETLAPQPLPADEMNVAETAEVEKAVEEAPQETIAQPDMQVAPEASVDKTTEPENVEPVTTQTPAKAAQPENTQNVEKAQPSLKMEKEPTDLKVAPEEIRIQPVLISAYETMRQEGPQVAPNYEMLTLILPPESVQGPMMKERGSKEKPLTQPMPSKEKATVLTTPHSLVIEEMSDEADEQKDITAETSVPEKEEGKNIPAKEENISFKKLTEALMNAQTEYPLDDEITPENNPEPQKTAQNTLKKETAALAPKAKIAPKSWVIDANALGNKSFLNGLAKYKGVISNLTLKGMTNADYSKMNQFIKEHANQFQLDTVSIENHHVKTPTISVPLKAPKYDFSKANLKEVDTIKILPTQNTLNLVLNDLDHSDIDFSNCQKTEALNLSLHHSDSVQDLKLPPQLKKLTLDTDNTALVDQMRKKYPAIEIIAPKQDKASKAGGKKTLTVSDALRQKASKSM